MNYNPTTYHQYEFDCQNIQDYLECANEGARDAHRWAGVLRMVLDKAITEFASIKSKNTQLPRFLEAAKLFADTIFYSTLFVKLYALDDPEEFPPVPVWPRNNICIYGNENCPYSTNCPDCPPTQAEADCPPPFDEEPCECD